ncbi:hypothetical protein DCAR_0830700 [Daucus carota subsp. sativus]|uniref:Glutathione hydrolase n=1 Tax=Daucus carota subsp. sativus TaxID=79200 RepID=A0A175YJP7_DAUCS|nr:PREDICTED: gamma-glutamyltranspeptidase 3-like [Daucus carota subsp. sativus]WOH11220.1 hypothetical protein DCAR_0830700 [Daucus carota subsp. sativus]
MKQLRLEDPLLVTSGNSSTTRWLRALCFFLALTAITFAGLTLSGYLEFGIVRGGGNYGNEGLSFGNEEVVKSDKAVVAADDARCSETGVSVLGQGGHAVDAAVATALCLGVVNAMASGIGGGGFMVVRSSATSRTEAINMRETAPLASSQTMYDNNPETKYKGALSMGVPGELAGLYEAWSRHGRLPWKTLFQPAIKLARDGFVIAPYLGNYIADYSDSIMRDPGLRQVYAPGGKLLKAGEKCYNVELGHSLEAIGELGPKAFYDGSIGERFVQDVRKAGGILTMEDLRSYRVDVTEAVSVNAMGYTILGMPSPSSGTLGISLVLNILESYGSTYAAMGSLGLHRLIEALKHMFAVRMDLGDPNFVNITKTVADMLSPAFAKRIQQRIFDNTTFPSEYYLHRWSQLRDHGTSHFCIVDADRNAVSLTTTVNYPFGAKVLSPSTGIVLNNEMDDFSTPAEVSPDQLPPAPANFIEPKKRPLSSMTPVVVLRDNQLVGVIGGSGGLYIIPAILQVFLNHFALGMEPLSAVQGPRVYHKLIPNVVLYEDWTCLDGEHIEVVPEVRRFLEERGHELEAKSGGAISQLIVQDLRNAIPMDRENGKGTSDQVLCGILTGVSDPRKDGKPAAMR